MKPSLDSRAPTTQGVLRAPSDGNGWGLETLSGELFAGQVQRLAPSTAACGLSQINSSAAVHGRLRGTFTTSRRAIGTSLAAYGRDDN
jgi:hypothetical protein